jgi:hypothetical protein
MPISPSEWQSLLPYSFVGVVYWFRDRYVYNRGGKKVTSVQWTVLFLLYPLWAWMEWTYGMQISRNDWWYIGLGTVPRTWVGHLTTVFVLNNSYRQTWQQLQGFLVSLLIAYGWALVGTLLYSQQQCENVVCARNDTCH